MLTFDDAPEVIGSCETRCSTFFSSRRNRSAVFNSSRTLLRASSSEAPPLTARSYSCSRCCESSSTISASRAGDNWRSDTRTLISVLKSGMLNPSDQIDGFDELTPPGPLLRQHVLARCCQALVAPPALDCLFNPAATDPIPFLKSIQ